jgi:hypothetical protein
LVLAAVNFDNQARVVADKIGNVTPQGHLPAESVPVDLIQSQDSPDAFLGVSHISSQGSCTLPRPGNRMPFHFRH